MITLAAIVQAVAVIFACGAVVSCVYAWKREVIGKRQIELAEQALAKFFEVKDAVAFIRNPYAPEDEGKSRKKSEHESSSESALLDRGYIIVERYSRKEVVFAEFSALKYRFIASFGADTEPIFTETHTVVNAMVLSARQLATHSWQRQGGASTDEDEFQKHLDEMSRHEGIFWDLGTDKDETRIRLAEIQQKLENATAASFKEPTRGLPLHGTKWSEYADHAMAMWSMRLTRDGVKNITTVIVVAVAACVFLWLLMR